MVLQKARSFKAPSCLRVVWVGRDDVRCDDPGIGCTPRNGLGGISGKRSSHFADSRRFSGFHRKESQIKQPYQNAQEQMQVGRTSDQEGLGETGATPLFSL